MQTKKVNIWRKKTKFWREVRAAAAARRGGGAGGRRAARGRAPGLARRRPGAVRLRAGCTAWCIAKGAGSGRNFSKILSKFRQIVAKFS